MKKTILSLALMTMLATGAVAMAAPLQNPQAGEFKLNLNYGFSQKEAGHDAHSRFAGGDLTYGVGHNLSLQYANNMTRSDDSRKIDEHLFSGIYQVSQYISAYGGITYVKTDFPQSDRHATGYQVGLKGQLPLTDRITGFASVGVGDDVNSYEVGMGYAFNNGWDAHLKYRRSSIDVDNYDDSVKGWQVGMGYKF
jgi:opacity protein-like surface antigen